MHEVLVNRLGGLSLPRKSVVRLTDRPDMTLDVYRGRKTTNQQSTFSHGSTQLNTDRDTKELIEKLVLSRVYPHVFTNGETGFFKHAKCFFLINRRGFLSAPDKKG